MPGATHSLLICKRRDRSSSTGGQAAMKPHIDFALAKGNPVSKTGDHNENMPGVSIWGGRRKCARRRKDATVHGRRMPGRLCISMRPAAGWIRPDTPPSRSNRRTLGGCCKCRAAKSCWPHGALPSMCSAPGAIAGTCSNGIGPACQASGEKCIALARESHYRKRPLRLVWLFRT